MQKCLYLAICLALGLFVGLSVDAQGLEQRAKDALMIEKMVEKYHIQPRPLDDAMSAALYAQVLEALDDEHIFFTRDDIRQLSVYRLKLDDEVRDQQTNFLALATRLYQQRLMQADTIIDHISAKPFDLRSREIFTFGDSSYAADLAGIRRRLSQLLKFIVINAIADFCLERERAVSPQLTDSLEPILRKKASTTVKRSIKRILQSPAGIGSTVGTLYCQALALCFDPHTEYFTMDEKAAFETMLGNKQVSFGLSLTEDEDGNPKIGRLKPGGPAFQSGVLHEGDKILSIQWDAKDPIDISGAGTKEVEDILSTEGGEKLTLNVKKADGTIRQAILHKEKLDADGEDDKVKGFILKGSKTIGYISLPAFYEDWEDKKGINGCANDVAKEIIRLKKENIGGLILDLRYNGGGSVQEAVELAGIFIDAGPVAQIKARLPKVITLKDVNRGTIYDGPLLLLVNGSSASASELVAGTLQDYNRALIAGSPTFGKATAQVVLPIDTTLDLETYAGEKTGTAYIKLTTSRLFRINGKTAQFDGVIPDIILPEPAEAVQERESDQKFALLPASIDANKYYKPLAALPLTDLQAGARKAMDADPFFVKARQYTSTGKPAAGQKEILLSVDNLLQDKKKRMLQPAHHGSEESENPSFTVSGHASEQPRLQADHGLYEMNEERKKNVAEDPYIRIAYQLVTLMIH